MKGIHEEQLSEPVERKPICSVLPTDTDPFKPSQRQEYDSSLIASPHHASI